jgi:DedD protein
MTASAADVNVDDLRRRARRRLVGAIVLALAVAVFVPMLLESDPKPLGEDVAVRIPPVDDGKFVNRLTDKGKVDAPASGARRGDAPRADPPMSEAAKVDATKVDTTKADAMKADATKAEPPKVEPRGDTTKAEAPADRAPTSAQRDSAPSAPKRTIAEAEQKMLGAPAKSGAAPAPAAKASPAASLPAAATVSAAASPTAPTDVAAGFSVQLAAFADDKGANALANKLKRAGYAAYTEPLETSKGTLWRVRVGPYPSREAAVADRDKLKGEGYSGIVAAAK